MTPNEQASPVELIDSQRIWRIARGFGTTDLEVIQLLLATETIASSGFASIGVVAGMPVDLGLKARPEKRIHVSRVPVDHLGGDQQASGDSNSYQLTEELKSN